MFSWRSVGTKSAWMFAATAMLIASQWAIVLSVARGGGAAELGKLSLAQAYVISCSYVAWLALRNNFLVASELGEEFSDYLFLRIGFPLMLYSTALGVLIFLDQDFQVIAIAFGLFVMKFSEGLSDVSAAAFQTADATRLIAVSATLRMGASIVIFIPIYVISDSIEAGLVALGVAWLLIFLLFENERREAVLPLRQRILKIDHQVAARRWRLFAQTFPLGFSSAVMILTNYIPRFELNSLVGLKELGNFTAVQYFLSLGAIFISIVSQALLPALAASVRKNQFKLVAGFVGVLGTIVAAACACVWLLVHFYGGPLIALIYGPKFSEAGPLFQQSIPCMFVIFLTAILATAATAFLLYRTIFASYVAAAAIVAASTWLLVPRMGTLGAFYSLAIGSVLQIIILSCAMLLCARRRQPDERIP
jgi:O-antigen/teichoic acid export membrane protein